MQRTIILILSLFLSVSVSAAGKIAICSDNNFWYPFTLVKDGKSAGMHIDIIAKALSNLGYQAEFKPLPWKRCLSEAEQGGMEAVATASYKDQRAVFMYYPSDAATAKKSDQRVMQVEYVVVTMADNNYEFNGDVTSIPAPIRAPRGYSIVDDLKKQGVKVDDKANGDENNIKKLIRGGTGSVVTIPEVVKVLSEKAEYKGKLKISAQPLKSKSYFLPISKASKLSTDEREKIWAEIAKVRDDAAFMAEVGAKY